MLGISELRRLNIVLSSPGCHGYGLTNLNMIDRIIHQSSFHILHAITPHKLMLGSGHRLLLLTYNISNYNSGLGLSNMTLFHFFMKHNSLSRGIGD